MTNLNYTVKQSDVPDSMLGRVPWGTPLKHWTVPMLQRGRDHAGDSPKLFDAICAEIASR